jgi:GDP-L-fucose synthase
MREEHLLTGPLEKTNEPYAVAKIAGIKMCEAYNDQYGTNFVSVMPTNLFGINDNFDLEGSHVVPALIRKVHEAKVQGDESVSVWGSGRPLREFLYVDDLAEACVFVMQQAHGRDMLNIGSGEEVSIRTLAETVCEVVGYDGKLIFDSSRPDGTPRKLLDSSRVNAMGWHAKTELKEGLQVTYRWFAENYGKSLKGL